MWVIYGGMIGGIIGAAILAFIDYKKPWDKRSYHTQEIYRKWFKFLGD
jgi:hypothetical protein